MARSTRLYTTHALNCGATVDLDPNASHHLLKVLRAKAGHELILFNGDGYDYISTLDGNDGKCALVTIKQKIKISNESPLDIVLLQGLSRGDRMDTTIQKSVELGVNKIIPFICERSNYSIKSDRIEKKMKHWQQIIISACEQSGRARLPELYAIQSFHEAVKLFDNRTRMLLSVDADKTLNSLEKPEKKICICIGPEGGLTTAEVNLALENNYLNIQFGPRILRTETAGPAIIAATQTLWGDFLTPGEPSQG